MTSLRILGICCAAAFGLACVAAQVACAQQAPLNGATSAEAPGGKPERDKDKFNRLSPYFRSWLHEDVVYLISPEEREAFLDTQSDEQRAQFIESFWYRRNPNEGSNENIFEEEHYRRIAYANDHFGNRVRGWKSDRGRIYIMFGPPDSVTAVPAGKDCDNVTGPEYGLVHDAPAHETWNYRHLEGIGEDVSYDFVARVAPNQGSANSAPSYVLSASPCKAPAFATPGMAPELMSKLIRRGDDGPPRTILTVAIGKAALPKNRDLEAIVTSHLVRTQLPLQLQFDPIAVTTITSLATVKVLVPAEALSQLTPEAHRAANFKVYGRLENTVTGWIESWFECDTAPNAQPHTGQQMPWLVACEKSLVLPAGVYGLRVAAKEEVSQTYGMASATVAVPGYVAEAPAKGGPASQ